MTTKFGYANKTDVTPTNPAIVAFNAARQTLVNESYEASFLTPPYSSGRVAHVAMYFIANGWRDGSYSPSLGKFYEGIINPAIGDSFVSSGLDFYEATKWNGFVWSNASKDYDSDSGRYSRRERDYAPSLVDFIEAVYAFILTATDNGEAPMSDYDYANL